MAGNKRKRRTASEVIEIDSEAEAREQEPRLGGALRGLNQSNVLPATQQTVEALDDDAPTEKGTQQSNHSTRQSRNGKSRVNYDMKYHPAFDDATRPKYAARRRSGSRSMSASGPREDVDETTDETLPSSARGTDDEESEDEDEASSDEDSPSNRLRDPKASRFSSRTAVKKPLYSTKHHPQDYALPGYQHKAKQLKHPSRSKKVKADASRKPKESTLPALPASSEAVNDMVDFACSQFPPSRTTPTPPKSDIAEDEGEVEVQGTPSSQVGLRGFRAFEAFEAMLTGSAAPHSSEDAEDEEPIEAGSEFLDQLEITETRGPVADSNESGGTEISDVEQPAGHATEETLLPFPIGNETISLPSTDGIDTTSSTQEQEQEEAAVDEGSSHGTDTVQEHHLSPNTSFHGPSPEVRKHADDPTQSTMRKALTEVSTNVPSRANSQTDADEQTSLKTLVGDDEEAGATRQQ